MSHSIVQCIRDKGNVHHARGNEPIANGHTYGQGQGQWSYRKGSVSDDVMEGIGSESGSESYVMMTLRGNGIEITKNGAVCKAVHVMGVRGMSPMRQCDVNGGQEAEAVWSGMGQGEG